MTFEFVTAMNMEIWLRYGCRSLETWQHEPRIYWQEQEQDEKWLEFRSRPHPEEAQSFKRTCLRFSHKVEAQIHALRTSPARYVIWLDADVVQTDRITDTELEGLMPQDGDCLSYLGRGHNYHPETGFIAYDREHPKTRQLADLLEQVYLSGQVYTLPEWHDAFVWDHCCRQLSLPRWNLCRSPHQPGEAFGRSLLSRYYKHHKGERKSQI